MTAEETAPDTRSPHWVSRAAFPVVSLSLFATQGVLTYAVYREWWWLAVLLVLVCCHLMHGVLIGFHEASHCMLRKNRLLNEIDGQLIGMFSLISFTVYRAAHQTHHMYVGTEKDEELWPFVDTTKSRGFRVILAWCELLCGQLFTPFVFFRSFVRRGSPIRSPRIRRKIWTEYFFIGLGWGAILTTVTVFGIWKYFLWVYVVPAYVAANLQSWRKYIEHVGLTGSTVRSATRSIVAEDWFGKFISFSLLHEPFHGVHHLRPGLSHAEMPLHAEVLTPEVEEEHVPFPSYTQALLHLVRELADPRVGAQWHRSVQKLDASAAAA